MLLIIVIFEYDVSKRRYNSMKSLNSSYIHTEYTTPKTQTSTHYEQELPSLRTTLTPQAKMVQFMTTTLKSFNTSLRASSVRRSNNDKQRISILPLTKDKIRGNLRTRKRVDQKDTFEGYRSGRISPAINIVQSLNSKQHYVQFFTMLSFMYNKLRKKSFKLEVLIDQLVAYFNERKSKEYYKDIQEIVKISDQLRSHLVIGQQTQFKYQTIKQCQGELSKLFFNVCFEIYLYKTHRYNLNILAIIHRDIQYYSRRLNMLNLTILCCLDMGKVHNEYFEFQKAAGEYSKAIKLAVYTGDKYSEQLAIDRLGMCQYYKGNLASAHFYHNSTARLSSYDRWKIREYYSNEQEIQKILEEKTKEKSIQDEIKEEFFKHNKENIEFNFDNMIKDNEFTQKNYDQFRNNLKQMIKINPLRKKVPAIKKILDKVQGIGHKTYRGKDYLVPKASKFHNKTNQNYQDQFLMSHKSFNRNNVNYQTAKIDKHCKLVDQILNFLTTDQRTINTQIREQRQSYMSDEQQ